MLLLAAWISLGVQGAAFCQDARQSFSIYFNPPNVLKFADALFAERDYANAIYEYKRYLDYTPAPVPEADRVNYRIAECYLETRQTENALTFLRKVSSDYPESPFRETAVLRTALALFEVGRYSESLATPGLDTLKTRAANPIRDKAVALDCANLLMQAQWDEALQRTNDFSADAGAGTKTVFSSLAKRGRITAHKSPALAGVLSAVVPGLGKVYSGRTWDGAYSFMTIGLGVWQAYDGFHRDGLSSFKGWAFGLLSSVLYFGNVYGSVVSVQIFNAARDERLKRDIRLAVRVQF